jgi:glycolate oxidase FAD binding subunit
VVGALSSAGARVSAYPGVGVAYGCWTGPVDAERLRLLRQVCETKNGALVIEKAPIETKQAIDVWGDPREGFGLMQRLKQELDASGVLNPGRFVGGI